MKSRLSAAALVVATVLSLTLFTARPALAAKPSIAIVASTTYAHVGASVSFHVSVIGGASKQKVSLQIRRGSSWETVSRKALPAKGPVKRITFTTKVAIAETVGVRVVLAKKGRTKAATSRIVSVTAVNPPGTTTPEPLEPGADPANPLPRDTAFTVGAWSLSLGATDTDAWPEIQAENQFNDGPAAGWSFVTVPVAINKLSGDPERPYSDLDVEFLGADHRIYNRTSGDQWCGVTPDDLSDVDDLYPGASASGNACAVVPTVAIAGGVWRVRSYSDDSGSYRYVKAD